MNDFISYTATQAATIGVGSGYYTTTAATAAVPSIWTWNVTPAPAAPAQVGWKCADCGCVLAPWRQLHRCGEDPDSATPAVTTAPQPGPRDVLCKTAGYDGSENT